VTRRLLFRACLTLIAAVVLITTALTAAGVWCPWSFIRFGGGYWRLSQQRSGLSGVQCLEVTGPDEVRQGNILSWQVTHRLTSADRIAGIREFLADHSSGWQENILSGDTVRQTFRACDGDEWRPRFMVGAETLGVQPSKSFSRPLCRRDRARIEQLLVPESHPQ